MERTTSEPGYTRTGLRSTSRYLYFYSGQESSRLCRLAYANGHRSMSTYVHATMCTEMSCYGGFAPDRERRVKYI